MTQCNLILLFFCSIVVGIGMLVGGEETRSRPHDLLQHPTPNLLQQGGPRQDEGLLQPSHMQQEGDMQQGHMQNDDHMQEGQMLQEGSGVFRSPTECEKADPTPSTSPPPPPRGSEPHRDSERQGVGQTPNEEIIHTVSEAGTDSPPTTTDVDDPNQSRFSESKSEGESEGESEAVLENIERMVISVVKRDTMRVNSEGKSIGHEHLYTETILRNILKTRKIRHRRHKAAQIANQEVENGDEIINDLIPSFPEGDMSNALQIGVPNEDDTRGEDRFVVGEDYERHHAETYDPRDGRWGGRWRPVTKYSSAVDEESEEDIRGEERRYPEAPSTLPAKYLSGKNTRPKFLANKHTVDADTYIEKMNFKGYQKKSEENNDSSSSRTLFFNIQDDANNISNDLSTGVQVEFSNYVEEPMVLSSVSPIRQVEAPPLHPVPSTTPLPSFRTTSSKRPISTSSQTYANFDSNLIMSDLLESDDSVGDPVVDENIDREGTGEENLAEESQGQEAEDEAGADDEEGSDSTSEKSPDPAYIPAKLPFGPFLPSLRRYKGHGGSGSIIGKLKPFFVPDDKRRMKKPNAGDLLTNVLSPIFGVQHGRSKSRGNNLLEYDNERSHNEELYNRVSGSFMPDFNSENTGYVPETYPYFPLVRRNKHRMFTSNKLHGGFAFIDRKHEHHGRPTIMEPPLMVDSRREQNLLIFGNVGDESIMDTLRNCSKHTTLQLIDHYSMDELIRESSSPLRQLIVYVNLKSVNYEGYTIVVERTKRIIDYLSSSQGGVTVYSVIPTEEEAINTTKSKEVKTQLLSLNDAVLDHCAQDYPTCYGTYSLTSIIQNLKRTYDKSSGFDVYDVGGRGNKACASNEVCGTRSPPTASSGTAHLASPDHQLADLAHAVCLSSYHLVVELVANMPTYDYEDYVRAFKNAKEESIR